MTVGRVEDTLGLVTGSAPNSGRSTCHPVEQGPQRNFNLHSTLFTQPPRQRRRSGSTSFILTSHIYMFRFGKKAASKKSQKEAAQATEEKAPEVVEVPGKIQFEEASPLAKAKAAADRKSRHVVEKGLPSFEEFGAKHLDDEEEEDEPEQTVKGNGASLVTSELVETRKGQRTRAISGGHLSPSRSPSPLPPPDFGILPGRRTSRMESREHDSNMLHARRHPEGYAIGRSPTRPGSVYPAEDYNSPRDTRYMSGKRILPLKADFASQRVFPLQTHTIVRLVPATGLLRRISLLITILSDIPSMNDTTHMKLMHTTLLTLSLAHLLLLTTMLVSPYTLPFKGMTPGHNTRPQPESVMCLLRLIDTLRKTRHTMICDGGQNHDPTLSRHRDQGLGMRQVGICPRISETQERLPTRPRVITELLHLTRSTTTTCIRTHLSDNTQKSLITLTSSPGLGQLIINVIIGRGPWTRRCPTSSICLISIQHIDSLGRLQLHSLLTDRSARRGQHLGMMSCHGVERTPCKLDSFLLHRRHLQSKHHLWSIIVNRSTLGTQRGKGIGAKYEIRSRRGRAMLLQGLRHLQNLVVNGSQAWHMNSPA